MDECGAAGGEGRGLAAVADRLYAAGDRGSLNHALDDVRHVDRDDEDDDRDPGDRQRRDELIGSGRGVGEPQEDIGADAGDHHQGHQLHADGEGIGQIADREILGVGGATEPEHDHAGEKPNIHLDHHRDEDRGDQREADDDHDHGEDGGDRQRVVLKEAEFGLVGHGRSDLQAGVEDVRRRRRSTTGADLVETVDDRLGETRALFEHEGEETDEQDPPDEGSEPAVERGGLDRQEDRGDPDLDAGEDPEQRARRLHDGRLPTARRRHHLVFQGGENTALLRESRNGHQDAGPGGDDRDRRRRIRSHPLPSPHQRGFICWPPVVS